MNISIVFFSVILTLLCLVIGFFFLVLTGNIFAMKLLAKNGLAVFSHKIETDSKLLSYVNKDSVCWLNIPNICYSPVMNNCNGEYKNHNFLRKPNRFGELYLSDSVKSNMLKDFSLCDNHVIRDLTIIKGKPEGNGNDLRHANFAYLRRIQKNIKENSDITICEDGKTRFFKPICMVELGFGDSHTFRYNSREDFIQSILDLSKIKTTSSVPKGSIIILECNTSIDIVLVLLQEKVEV